MVVPIFAPGWVGVVVLGLVVLGFCWSVVLGLLVVPVVLLDGVACWSCDVVGAVVV